MKKYLYFILIGFASFCYAQEHEVNKWSSIFNSFTIEDSVNINTFLVGEGFAEPIWRSIGPGTNDILGMTFGDTNADIIYAASRDSGVIKTTNGGLEWNQKNNGITQNFIRSIDSHPKNGNIILAGTYYGGLFRSTNGGDSWEAIKSIEDSTILCVAFDQNHGDTVYIGTYSLGPYRSVDAGITWQRLTQDTLMALEVIIDPVEQNILYFISPIISKVFKSTDFGNSWELFYSGSPHILSLAINPLNNNTMFMGTNPADSLYKSYDGGKSWNRFLINGEGYIVTDIVIDPNDTNNIYISTPGWGVFRSTNSGEAWSSLNEGLSALQVIQLKLHPAITSSMYASTNGAAIFKIEDLLSGLIELGLSHPIAYLLLQNYPNPFNPSTTINYQIPELSFVTIKVYDVLGNEVATLVNEEKSAGSYEIEFDGNELTSGIYFYRIQAGNFVETKKMILLK